MAEAMSAHSPLRMADAALITEPTFGRERVLVFDEVYREHVAFVWRTLRHLGVAEADAEDGVQDVFVVVHAKLATFEHRARVSTWIYGICLRVAHARRRRAHVRREVATDPSLLLVDAPAETEGAPEAIERREAEAMLDAILDSMPLEQRAVFTLFELEGKSSEEIAELTSAPIGTVYSRLRLAREAFRRATAKLEARTRFEMEGGAR
jgi:RNA polymerase sigma-70 factor, ECF subfamily